MSHTHTFDVFLRLDDDYSLFLRRLLEELNILKHLRGAEHVIGTTTAVEKDTQTILQRRMADDTSKMDRLRDPPTAQILYRGHRFCNAGHSPMDMGIGLYLATS